jgi:hypothetical protein
MSYELRGCALSILDKEGIKERLNKHRNIVNGHWLWTGAVQSRLKQYGEMGIGGYNYSVNRLSLYCYTDSFDIDNPEIQALHKNECNIKNCFNPEHLYAGTNSENQQDLSRLIQATSTFRCGHARTPENTYKCWNKGKGYGLYCKTCKNKANAKNRLKQSLLKKQASTNVEQQLQ